ncbi:hypothetical protein V8C35DRAFT_287912 [Trichoderma chlorosporum]
MEEIYQRLSAVNLWQGFNNSDETSFEVIEARIQHASGEIITNSRIVCLKELDSWLAEEAEDDEDPNQSLVLRLALVGCDIKAKTLKLSRQVLDPLLDEFNLELAYKYSQSCITNVSAIPSKGSQTYSFCYMPKLVAVWTQKHLNRRTTSGRPHLTQGLIFVEESNKGFLSDNLCSSWNALLYHSPMFPALLFSMILSMQIHVEEAKIKTKLRKIEERTGQDRMADRKHEDNTTAEYIKLAAQVDRHAVKLASVGRKSKMAEKTLAFILKNTPEQRASESATEMAPSDMPYHLLRSHVSLLQDRLSMQAVDIEFTLKRVQLQANTLTGIISRDDVKANLDLAESQHRDSLSMKTLAIVTMVFLPGSFISALFSTSMFD